VDLGVSAGRGYVTYVSVVSQGISVSVNLDAVSALILFANTLLLVISLKLIFDPEIQSIYILYMCILIRAHQDEFCDM
jgi:hypothetical protein